MEAGVIIAIISLCVAGLSFLFNRKSETKRETKERGEFDGKVLEKIDSLTGTVEKMDRKIDTINDTIKESSNEIVKLNEKMKTAFNRLDILDEWKKSIEERMLQKNGE